MAAKSRLSRFIWQATRQCAQVYPFDWYDTVYEDRPPASTSDLSECNPPRGTPRSRLGADDVSVQIQWLGADRWQGWSQRWGKQDLRTGIFGTISIWTITIMIFNNVETPAPFGVLLNCKEINMWAQILQNLFMASPFSYLLCQCLASANAEKLSNVQCFRSKADEWTGEVFAILDWDLKSRGVCRRWVL